MKYNWNLPFGTSKCGHGTDESNQCDKCNEHYDKYVKYADYRRAVKIEEDRIKADHPNLSEKERDIMMFNYFE